MKNKIIIIISPDAWNSLHVSKHHYAIELAKTNTVFFIDKEQSSENSIDKNVHIIRAYKRKKGINRLPKLLSKWLMKKEIDSILKQTGIPDIVWSFDTSRLYHLDLFNAKVKIAHIVDYNEHYKFNELVGAADFCFATSDSIIDKIKKQNNQGYKINHGFYASHEIDDYTSNINENNVSGIYVGNLNIKYLDWEAVNILIKHRSDIMFYFIGTLDSNTEINQNKFFKEVYDAQNTKFIEAIAPENIMLELKKATFCFMTYQAEKHPLQLQNPHKTIQYLGSGTPVFCSFTHEYKNSNLVSMYFNKNDIIEKFDAFISNKNNDFTEEARSKRINFALDNIYSKQLERISSIIEHR